MDISTLADNQPDVMVRFRYYNARFEWWWQVDNVRVRSVICTPQSGGLVDPIALELWGDPGSALTYTLTITNTGINADRLDLNVSQHNWPVTLAATVVGPLAPGLSATVTVTAEVPASALAGDSDTVVLTIS